VILYHPNGKALVLSAAAWRRALKAGQSAGWRPAGTLPPPADFDRPPALWEGAYEPALGQQVSRPDARALAAALDRALESDRHLGHELRLLAEFCASGGFLVCASPGIADSLSSLVEQAGTAVSVPAVAPPNLPPQRPPSRAADTVPRP
jgi:hypothetical protein